MIIDSSGTAIIVASLLAAVVNGAIGYGFSTLLVPVALLFYPSRVLNPGLVLAEIALNVIAVGINWRGVRRVWREVLPMMVASLPGIALGGFVIKVASADTLRFGTFVILLPLVLFQAAGIRRASSSLRQLGIPAGFGIGILYSCTTISGPPLALLFNQRGYAKDDFRSALSLFRITESAATGLVYLFLAVYTPQSVKLSYQILPCIVIGSFLGRMVLRGAEPETFRRLCMAFDAWLISFSLSRLMGSHGGVMASLAYAPMLLVLLVDAVVLYIYFKKRRANGSTLTPASGPVSGP